MYKSDKASSKKVSYPKTGSNITGSFLEALNKYQGD